MSKCHKCNLLSRKEVNDYLPFHELVESSFLYKCIDGRTALTTDELIKECEGFDEIVKPTVKRYKIIKKEAMNEN